MAFPWAAVGPILSGIGAIGSLFGGGSGKDAWKAQLRAQYDFAKMGIRWRVRDAKKAGLHPLAAIGMNPATFNPQGVFNEGDDKFGGTLQAMGQMINDIVNSREEKELKKLETDYKKEVIEGQKIQNEKQRRELSKKPLPLDPGGIVPGSETHGMRFITDGQEDAYFNTDKYVNYNKPDIPISVTPGIEVGVRPWMRVYRDIMDNSIRIVPDPEVLEAIGEIASEDVQYGIENAYNKIRGIFNTQGHKELMERLRPLFKTIKLKNNETIVWSKAKGRPVIVNKYVHNAKVRKARRKRYPKSTFHKIKRR